MHTSELDQKYLLVYKSAKNGSVFKMIPEINRKKSIGLEQLNFMFSLRYKSNAKRNIFLGHPVAYMTKKHKNSLIIIFFFMNFVLQSYFSYFQVLVRRRNHIKILDVWDIKFLCWGSTELRGA